MLFQRQVLNVLLASRQPGVGFHTQAAWAPKQIDTETCHVYVVAWQLFRSVENCMP
jgi:hypothetical protein